MANVVMRRFKGAQPIGSIYLMGQVGHFRVGSSGEQLTVDNHHILNTVMDYRFFHGFHSPLLLAGKSDERFARRLRLQVFTRRFGVFPARGTVGGGEFAIR
jgi:hypothetical protein